MSDPPRSDHGTEVGSLLECTDCGLVQRIVPVAKGSVAVCGRCRSVLWRPRSNSVSLACACAAAALFSFALGSPLMSLRAAGRFTTSTVFGGPAALSGFGFEEVGGLVIATLVVAPIAKLIILLASFAGERSRFPPRWLPWAYGWLERLGPWAMVEVFLLGVFVAYSRLRAIASVEIGPSLVALVGVMVTMIAADATIDRRAIWDSFDRHGLRTRARGEAGGTLLGCRVCGLVSRLRPGSSCPRCRHSVHHRKPESVKRAWAFVVGAALMYIPANALSVTTVIRLGRGGPRTIVGGVIELFDDGLWPLALIVLTASIVVPLAKLGALAVMLIATHRRSAWCLQQRTRVLRFVNLIGRWSMIDIFALTTLVGLVRLGFLASVFPGNASIAFAAVVVLTMLATESFDSRLMWDAAEPALAVRRAS